MRLTFILLLLALVSVAQEKTNTACKALFYEPIFTPFGGPFIVTIVNDCKNCKVEGVGHGSLIVFDANGDTVASNEIDEIPKFNEKKKYQAFLNPRYPTKNEYPNLRVSLLPYCDNLKHKRK